MPTLANLFAKYIFHNPFYPKCVTVPEFVLHVTCDCPLTAQVRGYLGITWQGIYGAMGFGDWLLHLCNYTIAGRRETILTTVWAL